MKNKIFKIDLYRKIGNRKINIKDIFFEHDIAFIFFLRNAMVKKKFCCFFSIILQHYKHKYGLEISKHIKIGPGLYLGHAYNITINDKAVLGKNINIHKGVTIGAENRGIRKGVPIISDNVWIGVNAVIVGKVMIGSDVLIAPNTYVNCDIPDHSIVIGNPCKIIYKKDATLNYLQNIDWSNNFDEKSINNNV